MEEQLLSLLEDIRNEGDGASRRALNALLREQPKARTIMARLLVNEHALTSHLQHESIVSILDGRRRRSFSRQPDRLLRRSPAWQPMTAGLFLGLLLGVVGVRMVVGMPSDEPFARRIRIAAPHFQSLDVGLIPNQFPIRFGEWCGDPAEVIERADGNPGLRFLRTANVNGAGAGGAHSCDVFQLVDLQSLRENFGQMPSHDQIILKLSAVFRHDHPRSDLPALRGVCRICFFQAQPESISAHWPGILRDAIGVGGKAAPLGAGGEALVTASCILPPEATVAVISVSIHSGDPTGHAVDLGDSFASNISLTAIRQPVIPPQPLH